MVNTNLTAHRGARPRRTRPDGQTFEGVRRDGRRTRPDGGRKLGEALAARGQIAYWVVSPDVVLRNSRRPEQRADARESMRLRSAKVLDAAFRFVCECRICERSLNGLRLALARDIPLPRRLAVHIDESGDVRCAKVVWRRGIVIGVRLYEHASGIRPCDRFGEQEL